MHTTKYRKFIQKQRLSKHFEIETKGEELLFCHYKNYSASHARVIWLLVSLKEDYFL